MQRFYKEFALGLMVLPALMWTSLAHAAIANGVAQVNNANACTATWDWTLAAGPERGANPCQPNWLIIPHSPRGPAGGPKPLKFDLQHLVNPHVGEMLPKLVHVPAGLFAAGVSRAGITKVDHPGLHHSDVYNWVVNIPPTGGALGAPPEITVAAKHDLAPFNPAGWSYQPANGFPAIIASVTASYPTDPGKSGTHLPPVTRKVVSKQSGELPPGKTGEKPTDYSVKVTLGDPFSADMTLAYLTVDESGMFSEADLATMNEFFVPGGEFLVPMLFDVNETQDLFIGVDLTQWLSFPTVFSPGEVYSFTNGVSALLPGFFVATSPVSLDPVTGMFTSGDPLDGSGIALGTVDGGNVRVPEPSTGLLFGTGLLGLLYADWRRRRRAM